MITTTTSGGPTCTQSKGKFLVNIGTNPLAFSQQLGARLEKEGAPVSGTQVQARKKEENDGMREVPRRSRQGRGKGIGRPNPLQ